MGTTPNLNLPYPEPTDRARNGSVAIRALAEAVDTRLDIDGAVIGYGDSPTTTGDLALPGAVLLMDGFTFDGGSLTRTGPARTFIYYVEAEITVAPASAAPSLTATLVALFNGTQFAGATDRVDADTITGRKVVLSLAAPVRMAPGDTIKAVVSGTGGTVTVGQCTLRVYPIGPAAS